MHGRFGQGKSANAHSSDPVSNPRIATLLDAQYIKKDGTAAPNPGDGDCYVTVHRGSHCTKEKPCDVRCYADKVHVVPGDLSWCDQSGYVSRANCNMQLLNSCLSSVLFALAA